MHRQQCRECKQDPGSLRRNTYSIANTAYTVADSSTCCGRIASGWGGGGAGADTVTVCIASVDMNLCTGV
jgi:hypothetical protein